MSYSYSSNNNTTTTTTGNTNTSTSSTDTDATTTTSTPAASNSYTNSVSTPASTTVNTTTTTSTVNANTVTTTTVADTSLLPDDADVGDRAIIDGTTWEFTELNGWILISEGNFLRFPSDPNLLDRYAIANKTWEYDGTKWVLVYVGAVEDQDDYVKKSAVEHTEYFGGPTDVSPIKHDLYGDEIDLILNMLNNGPSAYTANDGIVIKTDRREIIGDSGGVIGTNFQGVHISLDLDLLTSVASIDISDISIGGASVIDVGTENTYVAILTGRPTNVAYSWSIQQFIDDQFRNVSPSVAQIVGDKDKSFVNIRFREEGEYQIAVLAQVLSTNNEGYIVINETLDTTEGITAEDILPDNDDVPNARRVTCFLNQELSEVVGGYKFFKRDIPFIDDSGSPSSVPIINFANTSKFGNGLHFVYTGLENAQSTPLDIASYEGYFMVHEDLMEDRLGWLTKINPDTSLPYNLSDVTTLLIGPPKTGELPSYGKMRTAPYTEGSTEALPPYFGVSAYNYQGYAIVDPYKPSNISPTITQADGVSVNSNISPDQINDPLQYIDASSTGVEPDQTSEKSEAINLHSVAESTIIELGNVISSGVLSGRFVRGKIQPTLEVINNTEVVRNHFIKDVNSKYFICNGKASKPAGSFTKIWLYDIYFEKDFNFSLAGAKKFEMNDTIDGAFMNYPPRATL